MSIANANLMPIARPYAAAAFQYAKAQQALPAWQIFLQKASAMITLPEVKALLTHPELTNTEAKQTFEDLLALDKTALDQPQRHFLGLVAQHKRFLALPNMAQLFDNDYARLRKMSTVRLVTAVTPKSDFCNKITTALCNRIQHEITLDCEVDPAIIGGAIIQMGDQVIDGSIRGKLSRLLARLTA